MKRKLYILLAVILVLVPWTVAYAYSDAQADTGAISITSAVEADLPVFNVFGGAIGGVAPGDLFTVDMSGGSADSRFTLCITNTDELIHCYSYMTLNIGIFIESTTLKWEKVGDSRGAAGEIYLTMQNGRISFSLDGGAVYKVSILKGCYNCHPLRPGDSIILPDFYLTTDE
jgi:hypothetical protein